jgi:imidazolonepropionase-like amidohydrolase
LVIQGGTVFDAVKGVSVRDRVIMIRGNRIAAVQSAGQSVTMPPDAKVIDARGKYLIPGLIDGHVHLMHVLNGCHMTGDEILPLFLAAGVTSVRDAGDAIVAQKLLARYADEHPTLSPRIFLCTPLIDGAPAYHPDVSRSITDPNEVPAYIEDMAAWGVATVKLYVRVKREVACKVIEEAHRHGLPVTAHLGSISAQAAISDGIDCLEHIWSAWYSAFPPNDAGVKSRMDLNNPAAQSLVQQMAMKKVMLCPTLTVFRNMLYLCDLSEVHGHPDNAVVPARLKKNWSSYRASRGFNAANRAPRAKEFGKYKELTGMLHRAGVTLLAGTDTPEPYCPPGFSLVQELELLVESGLTPAAALQAATMNNARALRQETNLGSIEPGKLADIVVLDADPLADIRNVRRIDYVIRNGLMCRPKELLKAVPVD